MTNITKQVKNEYIYGKYCNFFPLVAFFDHFRYDSISKERLYSVSVPVVENVFFANTNLRRAISGALGRNLLPVGTHKEETVMSHIHTPEQADLLNMLSQPVFLVQQEKIIFRNAAAIALTDSTEEQIQVFLGPEDLLLYRAFDGSSVMELTMVIDGRQYSALVRREGDADAFVARMKPLYESLHFDVLAVVAQAIRGELSELFDAASQLFPQLEEQEDPKIQRQTARMNKGLYGLLRLTGNLSDAGRYMAGEVRTYLERTEMVGFFEEICRTAESLCATVGVTLEYQCPDQMFYAAVDKQKLERAVLNLLSNALRYTPAGGKILLKVEDFGHSVHIRVSDNGQGMAPAELSTAFDHYEHRGQLPGDPRWGIGLGLPLVRYIANLHGGTVVVNSAEGEGTTVTMSISRRLEPTPREEVRSPVLNYDYAGGHDHAVLELADALPPDVFDTRNLL